MGGFTDFFRMVWRWLSSPPAAPVTHPRTGTWEVATRTGVWEDSSRTGVWELPE